jgi:hypothetical protein
MSQPLKYSEENVNLVRTSIENFIRTNPEFGYSVKVAGLLVVPRTRKISLFDSFRDHVNDSTEEVVFTIYHGKSNGGEPIKMSVNRDSAERTALSGNQDMLKSTAEKSEMRAQIYNELQNDFLKNENDRLKKELTKAEKFIHEVDVLLAQLRQQKAQVKDKGTLEVIGNFVNRLSALNPDFLKDNPTLEALLTFLPTTKEEAPPAENVISGTPEVIIKPKEQTQDPEVARAVELLQKLRYYFSEKEMQDCLTLLASLSDCKELIPYAIRWVEYQVEQKRKQRERKVQENTKTPEPERKTEPEVSEPKNENPQGGSFDDEEEEKIYHP